LIFPRRPPHHRNVTWKNKVKGRAYGQKRRLRFQSLGLCTRCGQEKQRFDRKSCDACLELHRIKEETRRRPGICSHCHTAPVERLGLCDSCKAKVNSQANGWMTAISKIAKAAEALVLASEYVERDLPAADMLRARAQAAKSMRQLFRAVHELQQRRVSFKKRVPLERAA
jgi:hypothetical protein